MSNSLIESILQQKSVSKSNVSDGIDISTPNHNAQYLYKLNNERFQSSERVYAPTAVIGLDEKLDETKYIIGTGDGFVIYLWETLNKQINATVNIEGYCIVPDVGAIYVKGLTLQMAKDMIKNKILEQYKKIDMTILLDKIRDFKVYLLGEVQMPGAYNINGTTRISDLIQLAGGVKLTGALRNVEIFNAVDSTKKYADLILYSNCNNFEMNPYLNEGDRVFINKVDEVIVITGAVNYPGKFTYVENDSLLKVITLAGGLIRGADSSRIIVKRFQNNIDSLLTIACSYSELSGKDLKIQPDDRIIISFLPDYRVYRSVSIKGEVAYPGNYPIQKDKTNLGQIIEIAGGLTMDADLRNSKIIRKYDTKSSANELEIYKNMPPDLLSPLDKSYIMSKLNDQEGTISIDLVGLMNGENDVKQLILRDDDEISIQTRNLSVKLMGGLIFPGLIEFKKGESIRYYINKAGGYTSKASKFHMKIMKNGSSAWVSGREVNEIESGDIIWVPEKPYQNSLRTTKEIILLLGSVATVILSLFTINDYVNRKNNQ
jgi:protein involved in polysaccharide export with SLBB domain